MKRTTAVFVLIALWAAREAPVTAKVSIVSIGELSERAEFIGIVRVERISWRIPFLRLPQARATVLDGWKGRTEGWVTFVSAPTWTCDISEAKKGEQAVVFVQEGQLLHSGRGRMPVFARNGKQLAAIWPDVRLPESIVTEDGPQPEFPFIRAIAVADLKAAIPK